MTTRANVAHFMVAARARRKDLGLSQAQVAELIGVARVTLLAYESRGGAGLSLETSITLAGVLGLSLDSFVPTDLRYLGKRVSALAREAQAIRDEAYVKADEIRDEIHRVSRETIDNPQLQEQK